MYDAATQQRFTATQKSFDCNGPYSIFLLRKSRRKTNAKNLKTEFNIPFNVCFIGV
jgi:hypothetical protein